MTILKNRKNAITVMNNYRIANYLVSVCLKCGRCPPPIPRSCLHTSQKPLESKSKKWRWIVGTTTVGGISYYVYQKFLPEPENPKKASNAMVTLYRKMPLKVMSRAWGKFNQMELPVMLRQPLLGLYVWMFDCKLDEASNPDLKSYKNLGEFFRRTLKPDARTVDPIHDLTSPADGRILHFGVCKNGILEQVKGVTYSLKGFLGPLSWRGDIDDVNNLSDEEYHLKLKLKPGHELYHCVVYLAPGDYHRFHSASDWKVIYRRHFPGDLLSVSPGIARWIEGLFNFNERVVYAGTWKHGFFSYTAVGATNVGSIRVYCDKELTTNSKDRNIEPLRRDICMVSGTESGIPFQKGEMFGEFNLGSTIVLIFEAPSNFEFKVQTGQKVVYGQPLGYNRHVDLL